MPPAPVASRERLRAKPAANRRGQLGDRAGRGGIVPAIRRGQAVERVVTAGADAAAAIVVLAIVAIEERTQQLDLIDHRPRFEQRRERRGGRQRGAARRAARRRSRLSPARAGDRGRRGNAAPPSPTSSAAIDARSTSAPSNSNRKCGDRKQRHHRAAGEVRGRALEHDIDSGRVWLRGERQRVERFERNAGAGKHFAREIEVRQRPRHDEADAIERRLHAAAAIGLDAPAPPPSSSSSRSR